MVDDGVVAAVGDTTASSSSSPLPLPSLGQVEGWIVALQGDCSGLDDTQRIDLIGGLERLKSCIEGTQAVLTGDFAASQRGRAEAAGVPAARSGRGVAHQVALARRESPTRGQTHLGLATILPTELPATLAALRGGWTTEHKAIIIARETACLSLADRRRVDAEVAGDPAALAAKGVGELTGWLKARAAALDAASVSERRRRAEADRCTTLRPAPDTMTWFTACLPVKHGVAVHAALAAEADRLKAAGDPRSRGQLMADTLVDRVLRPHLTTTTDPGTGSSGGADGPASVPVVVNVVVPDTVLLGDPDDADGAGWVEGYGEVPGDLLREWVAANLEDEVGVWLRRLYATPATGELVGMDSRARCFPAGLAGYLRLRDRQCRTPWCDAPIRHLDHAREHQDGGPTSAGNGQGLCAACNHAKQARGWTARPRPAPRHTIETTTPTGHVYTSTAPPTRQRPPTTGPPARQVRGRRRRMVTMHVVHHAPELSWEPDAA